MVSTADVSLAQLADAHLLYPETFHDFAFDHVSRYRVLRLVSIIHKKIRGSDDEGAALTRILYTLVAEFLLERLSLRIDLEVPRIDVNGQELPLSVTELDPVDVVFLRYAAEQLQKKGLWVEVSRTPYVHDPGYGCLVSLGFTAPLLPSRYFEAADQEEDQE
jgi:hypothetical protein